jgi:hypothetical protein
MSEASGRGSAGSAIRLRLARMALLWERLWPGCWPALAVVATFLVTALFGLLQLLPAALHDAALLVFGAALLLAVGKALRGIGLPDADAARRRIERASGLAHRPLQALADRPSAPLEPPAAGLWEAHQRRMAAAARHLRIGRPAGSFAARDPWGVRVVLTMLLLLAAIDAGGDWHDRLLRALTPRLDSSGQAIVASLDIWVAPPEYTGLPPVFLRADNAQTVRIPIGSTLLAQVHGGGAAPDLLIDGQSHNFDKLDNENFRARATLKAGRRIAIVQAGATLGSWPIEIIPDNPPTVAFAKPPIATVRQALRLDYDASDDYGVESVKAVISRPDGKPSDKLEIELPLPGPACRSRSGSSPPTRSDKPARARRRGSICRNGNLPTRSRGRSSTSARSWRRIRGRARRLPRSSAICNQGLSDTAKTPSSFWHCASHRSGCGCKAIRARLPRSSNCCGTPRCGSRMAARQSLKTSCAGCSGNCSRRWRKMRQTRKSTA